MPLISVVVPVYKVEDYLEQCVNSILAQTFDDYEIILVDDGSPDNSQKMCDEFAANNAKIHVIHQQNGGLSAARNSGIEWALKNSDSEWITFIDSDDWIHPQYLELLLAANNKNKTVISFSKMAYVDSRTIETNKLDESSIDSCRPEDLFLYNEYDYDPVAACARLYKKDMFKDIRFLVGKLHEDTFTTYKLYFTQEKVSIVTEDLYYYFQNSDGIVHSSWSPKKLDLLEANEALLAYFKETGNDEMYQFILKRYIKNILTNMRAIKNEPKYKDYYKQLHKKLLTCINDNKDSLNLSFKNDMNICKYAYPIRAKIYMKTVQKLSRRKS